MKKRAANVYRWLWLSPLLTIPTFMVLILQDFGSQWVCQPRGTSCNFDLAFYISLVIATLISGSWHLLALRKAFDPRTNPFMRWHARQALVLAGIRTVLPIAFGLAFGVSSESLWVIPLLAAVWLFGTYWGQNQAHEGDCWLLRRWGSEADQNILREVQKHPVGSLSRSLDDFSSHKSIIRQKAVIKLGQVGENSDEVISALRQAANSDPDPFVQAKAAEALEVPVHWQFQNEAPELAQAERPIDIAKDAGVAYEQGLSLLKSDQMLEAIAQFTVAFVEGDGSIRAEAIAQLEMLDEIEVF